MTTGPPGWAFGSGTDGGLKPVMGWAIITGSAGLWSHSLVERQPPPPREQKEQELARHWASGEDGRYTVDDSPWSDSCERTHFFEYVSLPAPGILDGVSCSSSLRSFPPPFPFPPPPSS